jgi:hypothetical protein
VPTTTVVPLNTMLADLDESLRRLLKRELAKHGFDGVEIVFDAPDKEWSASLSSPTVNLFLYDLREAKNLRPIEWETEPGNGGREQRPPLRLDTSYAVTAWTRAVEDEHRLLSQVMAVLFAYPVVPDDVLVGRLANGSQRYEIKTRTAQERHEDASDFWTAVGGQYKASFNYVVTLTLEAGAALERGPEVRTRTLRLRDKDGPPSALEELHGVGGVVLGDDGASVTDAWVVLVETGNIVVTQQDGRFRFSRVTPGRYRVRARGPDGAEAEAAFTVPGAAVELTLSSSKAARKRSR